MAKEDENYEAAKRTGIFHDMEISPAVKSKLVLPIVQRVDLGHLIGRSGIVKLYTETVTDMASPLH